MCQLLAALLSMLALSCQQSPAFMSESAVHVLYGPRQCSLYALCMLSVYPTCVPTGCLLTPVGKGRKGSVSAWLQWRDVVSVPGLS